MSCGEIFLIKAMDIYLLFSLRLAFSLFFVVTTVVFLFDLIVKISCRRYQVYTWSKLNPHDVLNIMQKQRFAATFQNRCSLEFRNIHRKTPILESLFNEVAGLIFKSTFLYRTPLVAASDHINVQFMASCNHQGFVHIVKDKFPSTLLIIPYRGNNFLNFFIALILIMHGIDS